MSELKAKIVSEFDAGPVESGVAKVKRSMRDLTQTTEDAGKKGEEGLKKIGNGADGAAKKTDKAHTSMRRTLEQTIARMSAAGDKAKELELRMQMRGLDTSSFSGYLAKIRELQGAQQRLSATTESTAASLSSMLKPLLAGVGVTAFFSQLIGVQREFDRLSASLVTVTGSSEAAQAEMAWLKTFAKETPFGLAQATEAFVKMKALGLNPTKEALTSFGNTASAMGKDMMQFVEAVADATTGEYERLKEFGIKASKEGDKVSLTFQGVTKTISNSAEEIGHYLTAIGDNEFAGAMEQRLHTLDGAIAGLGDSWDEFIRTISNSGIGDSIAGTVRSVSAALDSYSQILSTVTAYQKETGNAASGVQEEFFSLSNAASNLAILTSEVSASVQDFGQKIGGLAAAGRALATDGLDAARAVIRDLDADGQATAARMEELRARLVGLISIQKNANTIIAEQAQGGLDAYLSGAATRSAPERSRPTSGGVSSSRKGGGGGRSGESQLESIRAQIKQEEELIARIRERGILADKLTEGEKLAIKIQQELTGKLTGKARAQKEVALAAAQELAGLQKTRVAEEARAKAIEASNEAMLKAIDTQLKGADANREQTQSIRDQIDAIGKSKTEVAAAALAREMAEFERAADSSSFDPRFLDAWLAKLKEGEAAIKAMRGLDFAEASYGADEMRRSLELGVQYAKQDLDLVFLSGDQRERVVAMREIERDLAEQIYKIDKMSISEAEKQTLKDKAAINARLRLEQTAAKQVSDSWQKTADTINESLTDALLRGFEDGKGFAENFRDTLKNMINTLVLKPVISFIVNPIGNVISTLINGALGSLTNGVLGGGNTLGSIWNAVSGANSANTAWGAVSQFLGGGSAGATGASLGFANGVGAVGGDSLGALIAGNGGWANVAVPAPGTVAAGSTTAGAGSTSGLGNLAAAWPVAAVLGAAFWGMSSMPSRPDYSGYASASSDPTRDAAAPTASGLTVDIANGIIPSLEALQAALADSTNGLSINDQYSLAVGPEDRLTWAGAPDLIGALERAGVTFADDLSREYLQRMSRGDQVFYTGEGYVDPSTMWIDGQSSGMRDFTYSAEMTQWGRQVAQSILGQLESVADVFDIEGDFSVIAGLRDEAKRDLLYAGLRIQQGDETLLDFESKVGEGGTQEALRQFVSQTLGVIGDMVPEWARGMVAETQTAINELDAEELGDKLGQTAIDSLNAVQAALVQTARVLDQLSKSVLEFGGYSQDVIYQITSLMGGVDSFNSVYSAYVQAFYTEQEQLDLLQRQLQEQFGALNVTMPSTIEGFRSLVESLDLNDEASRSLFASLLSISPQFAQFVTAMGTVEEVVEEVTKTVADLYAEAKSRTDGSFAAYQKNQQKVIDQWSDVQTAAEETADEVRSIFDLLHDSVRELRGDVSSTRAMQADQANEYISAALAAARATGVLPDYDGLSDAISGARGGLDSGRYSTRDAWEKDQLILAGKLEELEGYADTQLTAAERQAQYARDQIALITREIELFQEQIEEIRNGNKYLGTIAELAQAILDERAAAEAAANAEASASAGVSFGGGGKGGGVGNAFLEYATREEAAAESSRINAAGGYSYFYNVGGAWRVIDHKAVNGANSRDRMEDLRDSLNTVNSADEWWSNAAKAGATKDEIAAALNVASDDLQDWIKKNLPGYQLGVGGTLGKVPSYDVGTAFVPADGLAMIHKGERILTAADNRMITDAVMRNSGDRNTDRLVQTLQAGLGALTRQMMDVKRQLKHGVLTVDPLKEPA